MPCLFVLPSAYLPLASNLLIHGRTVLRGSFLFTSMRLLNCETLELELFTTWEDTPSYVILSHTWEKEEVTFDDIHESPKERDIRILRERLEELMSATPSTVNVTENSESTKFQGGNSKSDRATSITGRDYSAFPHLSYAIKNKGRTKVERCIREAKKYGIGYVWCDTCCIDKSSSAELSEAINSMWAWVRTTSLPSAKKDS